MQPLLKIQTVPISVEFKTQRAQLTPGQANSNKLATHHTSRNKGRANIQATPAKVNIDTTEAKASAGLKNTSRSISEYAEAGKAGASEATANYVSQGNQIVDSRGQGAPIAEAAASKMISSAETIMAFIPAAPPEITVDEGGISFDYTMDTLNFEWDAHKAPQLEFVPGSVEFSVEQYPEVIIEYIGTPNYVPASADPNLRG